MAKKSPRMTEAEVWQYVTDAHTGMLTTLRQDGVPITMPIWFTCLDRQIYIRTRGKKLTRIKNDQRSNFLVESGERWADLKAVHFTGISEIVDVTDDLAQRLQAEMDRKYAAARAQGNEMADKTREHYDTAIKGVVRFTPDERKLHWDNTKISAG